MFSQVPSIQPRFSTQASPSPPQLSPPPLSPPPFTQARRPAPTHPIGKRVVATQHGKPTLVKKIAVNRFNDSRQEESRRLNLKQKMEHNERMASIRLKKHKYDIRYGSTGIPQTLGSLTPELATAAATSKEDKQIEILRPQIRLAELTRDNSAHASSSCAATSSSKMPHASLSRTSWPTSSRMPHNSLQVEDVSTLSSGMSSLSYLGGLSHDGFVDNSSVEADMTSWPETYNFAA